MLNAEVKRVFIIGDEWLYFKIYSGPKTLEAILINELYSVVEDLFSRKIIDRFFFIRYSDPEHHLRIRFHTSETPGIGEIIKSINQSLSYYVEKRIVSKVVVDVYNRELERYGKNIIFDIESLFSWDSKAIIQVLKETNKNDDGRWLFCLGFIDAFLSKLNHTISDKLNFCTKMTDAYASEFHLNRPLKVQLDIKYRLYKGNIEKLFNGIAPFNISIIEKLISDCEEVINKLLFLDHEKQLEVPIEQLLSSIFHMHCNRLFRTQQRLNEFVIYYLLNKFYKSVNARLKNNSNTIIL